jgi:hypothetical protein
MTPYANLIGFDDDLWVYVEQLDDICQRLIRLVLTAVDSSINFPDSWPRAPFDCMYLARVVNRIGEARDVIQRALGGDFVVGPLEIPGEGMERFSRLNEALAYVATIENSTARATVELGLRLCINDTINGSDQPSGQFDMVYFAKMIERAFSTTSGNIKLILDGEGWKLDWE